MADGEASFNNRNRVTLVVKDATEAGLLALAHLIEGKAKVNIQQNGQIDTGFMLNSVYGFARSESGYGTARAAAESRTVSAKTGRVVKAEGRMASEPAFPGDDALAGVHVGANYAIYQELRKSFLFRAAEEGAEEGQGVLSGVYGSRVND